MQKTIWSIILSAVVITLFMGCDNELNVAAEYKETTVVYGTLDPTLTKNYVRIQRAYLDEKEAALTFRQIQDSLYYDTLDVSIDEYVNGQFARKIALTKVDGNDIGLPKDTGLFYSDNNILYELDATLRESGVLVDIEYVLTIVNPQTGNITRGSTLSIGRPTLRRPINEFTQNFAISDGEESTVRVIYEEGVYAYKYYMIMTTYIEEVNKVDPSVREVKEVTWPMLRGVRTKSEKNRIESEQIVSSSGFFSALAGALEADETIDRHLLSFDLDFYGVTEDFSTFIDVNKPSIGIVQKKPEFSNIENGLGIFTCRHNNNYVGLNFQPNTVNEIQTSTQTDDLGFVP